MKQQTYPHLKTFIWQGKNKSGNTLKGEINAATLMLAKAELRQQHIRIIKIKKKTPLLFSRFKKANIKSDDIAAFTRQLSTLLTAGIAIVQALDIVEKGQTNLAIKKLLNHIKTELASGSAFSSALRHYPDYFNNLYCNLVAAGEHTGTLDTMLTRLAAYREKIDHIKTAVKKALLYPLAVIFIALLITAGLLIFVVPKFQEVFSSFGAALPAPTLIVIHLSQLLQHYGWMISAAITALLWKAKRLYKRSPGFKKRIESYILGTPLIGSILHKAALARFARTLSTTFAAGLPLIEALQAVAYTAGYSIYCLAILQIREDVSGGITIHQAMKNTGIFPIMMIQMVAVGEESGALEFMLSKVADFYEEQVDNAVNGLSSLIEPMIMLILGILIGGLVIAMYLPIFRMGSVIAQ